MIIKKHRNNNNYCLVHGGLWVRDFTKKFAKEIDINNLIPAEDMQILIENELKNSERLWQKIETENFNHPYVVIVGDGYKFNDKHRLLEEISENICIIGVNQSIDRWQIKKRMNYYVVNNPYNECLSLPKDQKTWPRCIASSRTNPEFIKKYNGLVYLYNPTPNEHFSPSKETDFLIDDYRNPVCAAIHLAYKFEVKKILLLCLDEAYENQRPGAERLENGLWIYPQQRIAHGLVNGCLYWLAKAGIKVGYHCDGPEYKDTTYIKGEEIKTFFK
jgi:hypothetical protein